MTNSFMATIAKRRLSVTAAVEMKASSFDQKGSETDLEPMGFGSNIGRDVIKRASDFKSKEDAIFETIANAYESYNFGQEAVVTVDIVPGRHGFITVTDRGSGMNRRALRRFFSLHSHTERRVGGRNLRGYNGTGKVAPFVFGRLMRVDTVKDGLRNVVSMSLDEVERAARTETPIKLSDILVNEPTTDPDGTTITITKLHKPIKAEDIRVIRDKVSYELMMWMKGADIIINGESVEAREVVFDEDRIVKSDCGNFIAHIMYRAAGFNDELAHTFISCGPVFVARENFGKEGHKFSNRVHVHVTTTDEWCYEHFFNRRESFVSESRDLKLKTIDPKARDLRDFAVMAVSKFMKELVENEEKRKREEDDQLMRKWEHDLSRAFSAMWNHGGRNSSRSSTSTRKPQVEPRERVNRTRTAGKQPRVAIGLDRLGDPEIPYTICFDARHITINLDHNHIQALSTSSEDPTRQQALTEVAMDGFVELKVNLDMRKEFEETGVIDPKAFFDRYAEETRKVKGELRTNFAERYRAFAAIRSA